ncbi:MAG: hypothetical protein GY839_13200 [candidate division Zixibacteria bacterium]|nr:hypothetical protein [candidate division Zixibacteria bacterium]
MRLRGCITLFISLTMLLFLACGEDDSPFPDSPASATGTTDNDGLAELDLGSHIITVSVVDFIPTTISGIAVTAHLLKDYLYVYAAGNDEFYSNFKLVSYADMEGNSGIIYAPKPASPQGAAVFETNIEVTMERITRDVYSYNEEPAYTEDVQSDIWTTVTEGEGTLSDIYELANSIALDDAIFIHVVNDVATLTNAEVQTISIIMDDETITSDTVFAVLLGLEFHIFSADTLTYTYVDYGDITLPMIFINEATLVEGGFFAQFTLTWGEVPYDLDSHIWTPMIGVSSHHIYWVERGSIAGEPYVFLDVDDLFSWGPEHIVIQQEFPGTYYYSVRQFSDEGNIPNGDVKVSVLKPDRSVEEFTPPNVVGSGQGWYWHVCTIDGTTGIVTETGTMNEDPPVFAGQPDPMRSKPY